MFLKNFFNLFTGAKSISMAINELDFQIEELEKVAHGASQDLINEEERLKTFNSLYELKKTKIDFLYSYLEEVANNNLKALSEENTLKSELNQMDSLIEEVEFKVSNARLEDFTSKDSVANLKKELENKKFSIDLQTTNVSKAHYELEDIKLEITNLNSQIADLDVIYAKLNNELEEITKELMSQGFVRDSLGNLFRDKKEEYNNLDAKYKNLLVEKSNLEKNLKENKNIENELKCENIKLKQSLTDCNDDISRLEASLLEQNQKNATLESINQSMSINVEDLSKIKAAKSLEYNEKREKYSGLQSSRDLLNSKLLETQMKLSELEFSNTSLEQKNNELEVELRQNEALRLKVEKSIISASEALNQSKIENIEKLEKIKIVSSKIEERELDLSNITKEIKDNQVYLNELDTSITTLNNRVRELEREEIQNNENLHKGLLKHKELEEERQRLLSVRNIKSKNNTQDEEKILVIENKIKEEESLIEKTSHSLKEIEDSTLKLKSTIKTLSDKKEHLGTILAKDQELLDERQMLKDALIRQITNTESEIGKNTSEIEDLRYRLSLFNADISKSEMTLEQKVAKRNLLINEESDLNLKINDLQVKNKQIVEKINEVESYLATKHAELKPLNVSLSEQKMIFENNESSMSELLTKQDALVCELKKYQDELSELIEINGLVQNEIVQKQAECKKSEDEVSKLDLEIRKITQIIDANKTDSEALRTSLVEMTNTHSKLQLDFLNKSDLHEQYLTQISKLNSEIVKYEKNIETYSNDIREYDQKIIKLTNSQNELLKTRAHLESECSGYHQIVLDLKKQANKVIFENSESEKLINSLMKKAELLHQKKLDLQGLIERHDEELMKLKAKENSLINQNDKVNLEIHELSSANSSLEDKITSQINISSNLELQHTTQIQRLNELRNSRDELVQKLVALKQSLKQREQQVSDCSQTVSDVVANIDEVKNSILKVSARLHSSEDQLLLLEIDYNNKVSALADKQEELRAVELMAAAKEKDIEVTQEKRNQILSKLNDLNFQVDKNAAEIKVNSLKIASAKSEIENYKELIEEAKRSLSQSKAELEGSQVEFENVDSTRFELEKKYQSTLNQSKTLKAQLDVVKNHNAELVSIKNKYDSELKAVEVKINQYQSNFEDISTANNLLESQIESSKHDKEMLKAQFEDLSIKLKDVKNRVSSKQAHLNECVKNFGETENKLQELKIEYQRLTDTDKSLFNQINSYSVMTKELETRADKIQNDIQTKQEGVNKKRNIISSAKSFSSAVNNPVSSQVSLKDSLSTLEKKFSLEFFDASYNVEIEEISSFFKDGINVINDNLYGLIEMFQVVKKINVRSSKNLGQIKVVGTMKDSFLMGDNIKILKEVLLRNEYDIGFNITVTESGVCVDFKHVVTLKSSLGTN